MSCIKPQEKIAPQKAAFHATPPHHDLQCFLQFFDCLKIPKCKACGMRFSAFYVAQPPSAVIFCA